MSNYPGFLWRLNKLKFGEDQTFSRKFFGVFKEAKKLIRDAEDWDYMRYHYSPVYIAIYQESVNLRHPNETDWWFVRRVAFGLLKYKFWLIRQERGF